MYYQQDYRAKNISWFNGLDHKNAVNIFLHDNEADQTNNTMKLSVGLLDLPVFMRAKIWRKITFEKNNRPNQKFKF